MLRENDVVRLRHMLDAARAVRRFTADRQRADLASDDMLAFAVARALSQPNAVEYRPTASGLKVLSWSMISSWVENAPFMKRRSCPSAIRLEAT